jgi:uncharacterized membrane protein
MGLNWAEHTVEIGAPIDICFAAIIDYETFPTWQRAVVDTEVLDWDEQGRGKRVRLFIDAKVRKVDYTLDYRYEQPNRIEWDFVEGNGINDADGYYLFEDLGGDRTKATYRFGLEVGIPLPGPVARRAHKSTLKASVEDLKREAEKRAANAGRQGSAKEPTGGLSGEQGTPTAAGDWDSDGTPSLAELPAEVVGSAVSAGRRVTGRAVRTARGVTDGAAGVGLGITRRAVGIPLKVAGRVTNRASRALGRNSGGSNH